MRGELLRGEAADIFRVHPGELVHVENRGGFAHALHAERLDEFIHREELPLVPGVPAEQRHIVDDRFLEIALGEEILIIRVAIPLGKLVLRIAHDGRHVDVSGLFPAERLIKQVVLRRGSKVFVAAHHMGDAHGVIVNDVCEVVGGHAVRLDEDHVIQLRAVHRDVAIDHIVKRGLAGFRHVLADDVRLARSNAALHFLLGHVEAVLVVLEGLAAGSRSLAPRVQLFLGAEAVISLAFPHELLRIG